MDSIEVRISKARGLITIRVSGHFNEDLLRRIVTRTESHPDFSIDFDVLFDASRLHFDRLEPAHFARFAGMVQDGDHRVAIVAGRDLAYGISRMYEAWTDQRRQRRLRVLRSTEEALRWLGADETAADARPAAR